MGSQSPLSIREQISANLASIKQRISAACDRAGRDSADVCTVVVTKYTPLPTVQELIATGATALGENRPQQLIERAGELAGNVKWHLIGQLQRNKVRAVIPLTTLIHSVDSLRLLEQIDRIAGEMGITPRVLLQVNTSGEEAKSGFSVPELASKWEAIEAKEHVQLTGFMTMAPDTDDVAVIRETFRRLREVRDEYATADRPLQELSMGMSNDFEIAVEEGATLIRLGRIVFRGCEQP